MSSQEETKNKQTKSKKSKAVKADDVLKQEIVKTEPEIVSETTGIDNSIEEQKETNDEEISFETSLDTELENSEYIKHLTIIKEAYEKLNTMPFKNLSPTPDFFTNMMSLKKKINKDSSKLNESITDYIEKEVLSQIKKGHKSKKNKNKSTDKSKSSVNVPKDTYPEVCLFMDIPEGSQVSQSSVHRKICNIVKQYKIGGNKDIIVEKNNKSFNIVGDLVPIFDFFRNQMIALGDLAEDKKEDFPKVSSYTDMMKYLHYCFHPKKK